MLLPSGLCHHKVRAQLVFVTFFLVAALYLLATKLPRHHASAPAPTSPTWRRSSLGESAPPPPTPPPPTPSPPIPGTRLLGHLTLPNYDASTLDQLFTDGRCYKPGTSGGASRGACECAHGWTGAHCSVPEFVAKSDGFHRFNLSLRAVPRRVVCSCLGNHELEMFEMRVNELARVCDLFVIGESNYTFHGDAKPLHFLDHFRQGWLSHLQERLLYVFTGDFAAGGVENGWVEQDHLRGKLGEAMMRRIRGYQPDDIIIYTDIDEVPRQETVMFLKMHDGYVVPFGWWMRWSLYGYYGRMSHLNRFGSEPLHKMVGATVDVFSRTFGNSTANLRQKTGHLQRWFMGSSMRYPSLVAGWHCSWCGPVESIQTKLSSLPSGDGVRWGERRNMTLEYLETLVAKGLWFDEASAEAEDIQPDDDPLFSPAYVLQNRDKYKYYISNLYKMQSETEMAGNKLQRQEEQQAKETNPKERWRRKKRLKNNNL